jgi:hypothetical protein
MKGNERNWKRRRAYRIGRWPEVIVYSGPNSPAENPHHEKS